MSLNSHWLQMSLRSLFFLWEASCYEYFLVSHDVVIYCMLVLVDPYGRHYRLPFRSRHRILDIILLELVFFDHSLLPFLLVYFFIAGRLCINDVAQQCHITRVCLSPLSFFGSIVILFFILDYFSCPRWSSSFEVDLRSLYIILKLFLSPWCLWPGKRQVPLLNCRYLFFRMIYKSSSFAWLETYHNFQNILILTNICHIGMRIF